MRKIIRINEQQLKEVESDFNYFTDNTIKPYDGTSHISADGKIESGTENADPTLGDKIQHMITPQSWSRWRALHTWSANPYGSSTWSTNPYAVEGDSDFDDDIEVVLDDEKDIDEGVDPTKSDTDNNGIDDFYDDTTKEMDIYSNDVDNDNLTKVPQTIQSRVEALAKQIESNNLTPKQQAIVLNKIIEALKLKDIPTSWKKTLMMKVFANNK